MAAADVTWVLAWQHALASVTVSTSCELYHCGLQGRTVDQPAVHGTLRCPDLCLSRARKGCLTKRIKFHHLPLCAIAAVTRRSIGHSTGPATCCRPATAVSGCAIQAVALHAVQACDGRHLPLQRHQVGWLAVHQDRFVLEHQRQPSSGQLHCSLTAGHDVQLPRLLRAAELFPAASKYPALHLQPSPSGVAACTCTRQCSNALCGRLKHDHSTHRIRRTTAALQPSCVKKGGSVQAGVLQRDHCSISLHKQQGHKQQALHSESTVGGSSCGS